MSPDHIELPPSLSLSPICLTHWLFFSSSGHIIRSLTVPTALEQEIVWRSYHHTCMVERQAYETYMRDSVLPALEQEEKERKEGQKHHLRRSSRRSAAAGRKRSAPGEEGDASSASTTPSRRKRARTVDSQTQAATPVRITRSRARSRNSGDGAGDAVEKETPKPSRRSSRKRKPKTLDLEEEVSARRFAMEKPHSSASSVLDDPQEEEGETGTAAGETEEVDAEEGTSTTTLILTLPRRMNVWRPPLRVPGRDGQNGKARSAERQRRFHEYLLSTEGVQEWLQQRESEDSAVFTFLCVAPNGHVIVGIRDAAAVTDPTSPIYYNAGAVEKEIIAKRKYWALQRKERSRHLNAVAKLVSWLLLFLFRTFPMLRSMTVMC